MVSLQQHNNLSSTFLCSQAMNANPESLHRTRSYAEPETGSAAPSMARAGMGS